MASATVQLSNYAFTGGFLSWSAASGSYPSLGTALSDDGATEQFLASIRFRAGAPQGETALRLSGTASENPDMAGPEFSDAMEANGTITLVDSGGASIVITGISDSTEPYNWTPSNGAALRAWAITARDRSDQTISITFDDGVTAPDVHVRVSGAYRQIESAHVRVSGAYVEADAVHVRVNGAYVEV